MGRRRCEPPQRHVLQRRLPPGQQTGRHVAGGRRAVQLGQPAGAVGVGVVGREPGLVEQLPVDVVQGRDGPADLGGQPGPRRQVGELETAARPPSLSATKPFGVGTENGSRRASMPSRATVMSICAPAARVSGARTTHRRCCVSWTKASSNCCPSRDSTASTVAGSSPGMAALARAARARALRVTGTPYVEAAA